MQNTVSGTSFVTFRDEDLTVDWIITRGRIPALNEPDEADTIEVTDVLIDLDGAPAPCSDALYEAFVQDMAALEYLMETAIEEAIQQKEDAFNLTM